ncbi:MAG: hypothetical protein PHQ18_01525 [Patescibacteria group bacterium]|nr:hypothetical protein [Patescibacteria group bacterium]
MPKKQSAKTAAPQSKHKKQKKEKVPTSISDLLFSQLQKWAHAGTAESIEKLEDFIVREPSKELREYAKIAYDEALFFYYSPNSKQEEKDFLTAKMIIQKERRLWDRMDKAGAARFELSKMDVERDIHKRMIKTATKKEQEEWKYNFSEDYYTTVRMRLAELTDEIEYTSAWIKTAHEAIKLKKYKQVPEDLFDHIHFDGEDSTFWEDDEDDDCNCDNSVDDEDRYENMMLPTTILPAPEPRDYPSKPSNMKNDISIEDIPF